jgi:hypothetical protein
VAPKLTVLAGALALADVDYLRRMYDAGMARKPQPYDALSAHPYELDVGASTQVSGVKYRFEDGVRALRAVMDRRGDRKRKMWLTEFGFSTCTNRGPCVDQQTQAARLRKSVTIAARWSYVGAAIVYVVRDTSPNSADFLSNFGLLDAAGARKSSYSAVRAEWECLRKKRPSDC